MDYKMLGRRLNIAGTKISVVTMPAVLNAMQGWISDRSGRYIVCRDVHGVIRARKDCALHASHDGADCVTPDGMPLVWTARLLGYKQISRVCGPDLLSEAVKRGVDRGWKHYFYGSSPPVLEKLVGELERKFPGVVISGSYSPPYRARTEEDDEIDCARIRASAADIVWVGLGCPKQERWMSNNARRCGGAVLVGIGAAFDFHAGTVARAPVWMRDCGLEWAFRISQEPGRLAGRYLASAPQFIVFALADVIKDRLAGFGLTRDKTLGLIPDTRAASTYYDSVQDDAND